MRQATLLFLIEDDHILLAMKKRGFGAGLWNGVGGKVKDGETVTAAAIRECREEIDVTPVGMWQVGRLAFTVEGRPDYGHDIHIFRCEHWKGTPQETDEMRPQWFKVAEIPYEQMWADDRIWLPYFLERRLFAGEVRMTEDGTISHARIAPDIVQL